MDGCSTGTLPSALPRASLPHRSLPARQSRPGRDLRTPGPARGPQAHVVQTRSDASITEFRHFRERVRLSSLIERKQCFPVVRGQVVRGEVPRSDAVEFHHHADELIELHAAVAIARAGPDRRVERRAIASFPRRQRRKPLARFFVEFHATLLRAHAKNAYEARWRLRPP